MRHPDRHADEDRTKSSERTETRDAGTQFDTASPEEESISHHVPRSPGPRHGSLHHLRRRKGMSSDHDGHSHGQHLHAELERQSQDLKSQVRYLEEQNALLTTQVLQLQPHQSSISYDQIRALYASMHGESQKLSGSYFEFPDLQNERHASIIREKEDFALVRDYGPELYMDLVRAKIVQTVLQHTWAMAFGAAKGDPVAEDLERSIWSFGDALIHASIDRPETVPMLIKLRADTTQMLIRDLFGLDPKVLSENASSSPSRMETIKQCEAMKSAAISIMNATEADIQSLMFPPASEDGEYIFVPTKAGRRSLERLVAASLFLTFNVRTARQLFSSTRVTRGQAFDGNLMEPFGAEGELGPDREVLLAVDRAMRVFDEQERAWICVQKATVILKPQKRGTAADADGLHDMSEDAGSDYVSLEGEAS